MKNEFLMRAIKLSAVIALLLPTGCAHYEKVVLDNTDECGPEFTRTLAKEYEQLGDTEENVMFDEDSALFYFNKALRSKQGNVIEPTHPEYWGIEQDKLPELLAARQRLLRAMEFGARDVAPKMTAYTQAHYDCWVEQQAEGWQKDDIATCRSEYYIGMADVEFELMGGAEKVLPHSMVFFDLNSAHLTKDMMETIEQAAANEKASGYKGHILLVGRTDLVGDLKHNKNLSRNRAMAVKKELIRRGVPPHLINIKAAGETPGPKVDTHNRRVDIIFLDTK